MLWSKTTGRTSPVSRTVCGHDGLNRRVRCCAGAPRWLLRPGARQLCRATAMTTRRTGHPEPPRGVLQDQQLQVCAVRQRCPVRPPRSGGHGSVDRRSAGAPGLAGGVVAGVRDGIESRCVQVTEVDGVTAAVAAAYSLLELCDVIGDRNRADESWVKWFVVIRRVGGTPARSRGCLTAWVGVLGELADRFFDSGCGV